MRCFAATLILSASFGVSAEIHTIDTVPTTWRLENYVGDQVVVWYSPSVCGTGALEFPSNASLADRERFWSVLTAAKISRSRVFVRYEVAGNSCYIVSFGLSEKPVAG